MNWDEWVKRYEEWKRKYNNALSDYNHWRHHLREDFYNYYTNKELPPRPPYFNTPPPFPSPPMPPEVPPPKNPDNNDDKVDILYQSISRQETELMGANWKITSVFFAVSVSILLFFDKYNIESIFSAIMVLILNTSAFVIIISLHKEWLRNHFLKEIFEKNNFKLSKNKKVQEILFPNSYRKRAFSLDALFSPTIIGHAVLIIVAYLWVIYGDLLKNSFDYYIFIGSISVGFLIWFGLLIKYCYWFNYKFKRILERDFL